MRRQMEQEGLGDYFAHHVARLTRRRRLPPQLRIEQATRQRLLLLLLLLLLLDVGVCSLVCLTVQ